MRIRSVGHDVILADVDEKSRVGYVLNAIRCLYNCNQATDEELMNCLKFNVPSRFPQFTGTYTMGIPDYKHVPTNDVHLYTGVLDGILDKYNKINERYKESWKVPVENLQLAYNAYNRAETKKKWCRQEIKRIHRLDPEEMGAEEKKEMIEKLVKCIHNNEEISKVMKEEEIPREEFNVRKLILSFSKEKSLN